MGLVSGHGVVNIGGPYGFFVAGDGETDKETTG